MLIQVLRAKIHHLTVTEADLYYNCSLTLDEAIMEAAGMLPFQKVLVVNNDKG